MVVRKAPASRAKKPMASMASRSSRKLKPVAKLAKPAKLTRPNRPASLGAAAVASKPVRRTEELGAVDKVLVDLLSSVYRDLTVLVETFKRRLTTLRLPLKKRSG